MSIRRYQDDERILSAFLTCNRMTDIVRLTGLSKNTCYKLRKNEAFMHEVQRRKEQILHTAVGKMSEYMSRNVDTLQDIADDPEVNPAVRVQAINTMMNQLRSWIATTDLLARLTALEEATKGRF